MSSITHEEQQERWEKEHKNPNVLPQMDSTKGSSGVMKFYDWLLGRKAKPSALKGLEICCGKGRNVIWLAQQGAQMTGLDFSKSAIKAAKARAKEAGVDNKTQFFVQDVTNEFPVAPESLNFVIDCFGSTDIESLAGREAALKNIIRVLRPGGYLFVYLLSTDDEFQKQMIEKSPGPDKGSFIHTVNKKYEKAFTENEIKDFYKELDLQILERINKTDIFFGKEYKAKHIWAVFKKKS